MDETRLERLTRSFGVPRRTIISLCTGALGLRLGSRAKVAAATCGRVGYACPANTKCCAGALCQDGRCVCRRGLKDCNGTCADLESDETNCGGCDVACGPKETCHEGRCRRAEPL